HLEERSGFLYGVHRAQRFDGGIFLVTSVRGTQETLKEFPLTRRGLRPGLYLDDGPGVNLKSSPQGDIYFSLDLAEASHQGVDVRWWVLVPRGAPSTCFDVGPGKVKVPVGISPRG